MSTKEGEGEMSTKNIPGPLRVITLLNICHNYRRNKSNICLFYDLMLLSYSNKEKKAKNLSK